jgi:hypothetical protein
MGKNGYILTMQSLISNGSLSNCLSIVTRFLATYIVSIIKSKAP